MSAATPPPLALEDIESARANLATRLAPTPLTPGRDDLGHEIPGLFLKWETRQPTGSFKVRPAFHGILSRLAEARERGVLASSSGNFAQAVAYAARELGCEATIVMTSSSSPFKIELTRSLGAKVVLCEPRFEARWETTHRLHRETGAVMLHPYDSRETICADATLALELFEGVSPPRPRAPLPAPFRVAAPASGGGLIAGIATGLKLLDPRCEAIAVQPEGNGSLLRSWKAGAPTKSEKVATVADALIAVKPGELSFAAIRAAVSRVIEVSEREILDAVRAISRREGSKVEAGGAVAYAAFLAGKLECSAEEPLVCVLSGQNVDETLWKSWN